MMSKERSQPSMRIFVIISLLLHCTGFGGIAVLATMVSGTSVDPNVMVVELISSPMDAPADPFHEQTIHAEHSTPPHHKEIPDTVSHEPEVLPPAESVKESWTPVSTIEMNGEDPTLSPMLPEQRVVPASGPPHAAAEELPHLLKAEKNSEARGAGFETPAKESPAKGSTFLGDYLRQVRNQLERAKRYPWLARLQGQEGTVHLQFIITPLGEPGDARLVQSSGWESLDHEALALVKRVGQFPSPPRMEREGIRIQVPLVFQLEGP